METFAEYKTRIISSTKHRIAAGSVVLQMDNCHEPAPYFVPFFTEDDALIYAKARGPYGWNCCIHNSRTLDMEVTDILP